MNNNTKFKDCCDFITSKLPNIKCDFTNIKEMKVILKNLIDKRIIYLTENGNDDDLRNDLDLFELEDFYGMICEKCIVKKNN